MLAEFKQHLRELKLIPSDGGCFEFTIDGEVVWSKLQTGKFPDEKAMLAAVRSRLP